MDAREELDRLYLDTLALNDRAMALAAAVAKDTALTDAQRQTVSAEANTLIAGLASVRESITNALDPRR